MAGKKGVNPFAKGAMEKSAKDMAADKKMMAKKKTAKKKK